MLSEPEVTLHIICLVNHQSKPKNENALQSLKSCSYKWDPARFPRDNCALNLVLFANTPIKNTLKMNRHARDVCTKDPKQKTTLSTNMRKLRFQNISAEDESEPPQLLCTQIWITIPTEEKQT